MKIILDEQDIKTVLTDFVKAHFGSYMVLEELKSYTYTPTATFVQEDEDDSAQ